MVDLAKLTTDVDTLRDAVTSAVAELGGLSADIAALKAQVAALNDPTVQAAVDALDAKVTDTTKSLTDAVTANPA